MFAAALSSDLTDEPTELARTWNALGAMLWNQDLFHEAGAAYEKSRMFYKAVGDEASLIGVSNNLAIINAELGRTDLAISLFEAALAGYESQGDAQRSTQVNSNLALLKLNAGDTSGALENFESAHDLVPQDPNLRATFFKSYALALILVGRFEDAARNLRSALEIWAVFEDVPALSGAAIAVAYLGSMNRAGERHAQLLGASRTIEEQTGCYCSAIEKRLFDEAKTRIAESLGFERSVSELARGEKLSVADVTRMAGEEMQLLGKNSAKSLQKLL
jgi:tetratricopeptide (TPR) repeat protein